MKYLPHKFFRLGTAARRRVFESCLETLAHRARMFLGPLALRGLSAVGGKHAAGHAAIRSPRYRMPRVETLEPRRLLTAFLVNSFLDTVDINPGDGVALDAAGNTTLRAAIMEANAPPARADTITVPAGTYTLSIGGLAAASAGDLDISDTLTITGAGLASTVIDAAGIDRVFYIHEFVTANLSEIAITGGRASSNDGGGILNLGNLTIANTDVSNNGSPAFGTQKGGAIYNATSGTLKVTDSFISGNSAQNGGGIFNENSLEITGSVLLANSAKHNGGGIFNLQGATVDITASSLLDNSTTESHGGGILNRGTVTITDSMLNDNSAKLSGGGILNDLGSSLTVTNTEVFRNQAEDDGGGIYNFTNGTVTITNGSSVSDNVSSTGDGGGIYSVATLTINNSSTISNNSAKNGGGVYSLLNLTITDSTFSGNSTKDGGNGGGAYSRGTATITDSTFSDNSAAVGDGGGVFNGRFSTMTITNGTFSGNSANAGAGGGVYNSATATVTDSTFSGNSASFGGGLANDFSRLTINSSTISGNEADKGGGVYNLGTLTTTNTLFTKNKALRDGAAVYHQTHSFGPADARAERQGSFVSLASTISNSTFCHNDAGGRGGAIFSFGTLEVASSTIADNSARFGGGILRVNGTVSPKNTIVAGNTATKSDPDVAGNFASGGNNLIGDVGSSSGWMPPSDKLNRAARLGPCQFNGGTTHTMALGADSAAVEGGDNTAVAVTNDQRGAGFPRIVDGDGDGTATVDIGAYEAPNLPTVKVEEKVSMLEGQNGSTDLTIELSVSGQLTQPVGILYATRDGSATAGDDYGPASGVVTFVPDGPTVQAIDVPIFGDRLRELDETLFLDLFNPIGLVPVNNWVEITLNNDDSGVSDLPGGPFDSFPEAVSPDGRMVVGWSQSGLGFEGFSWTASGGIVGLGDPPGGGFDSGAADVANDGTAVGWASTSDGLEAVRFPPDGQPEALGRPPGDIMSWLTGSSEDGSVVGGSGFSAAGVFQGFHRTAVDGMVGLGDLPGGGVGSQVLGVSDDGSVLVGAFTA